MRKAPSITEDRDRGGGLGTRLLATILRFHISHSSFYNYSCAMLIADEHPWIEMFDFCYDKLN